MRVEWSGWVKSWDGLDRKARTEGEKEERSSSRSLGSKSSIDPRWTFYRLQDFLPLGGTEKGHQET